MTLPIPSPSIPNKFRFWLSFAAGLIGFGYLMVAGGYLWRGDYTVQLTGWVLGIGAGLAWAAINIIRRPTTRLPRTPLDLAIACSLLVIFISMAVSPDPRQGLARVSSLVGYALVLYLYLNLFAAGLDRNALLAALLAVSGLILAEAVLETALWYRQWFEAAGSFSLPPDQYRFHGLLMPGPTLGLANLLVGLAVLTFFRARKRFTRLLAAVWLTFFGLAFPFSSSRGGWLGLAAGLLVAALFWAVEKRLWTRFLDWPHRRIALAAVVILFGLAAVGCLGTRFLILFASQASHGGDPFGMTGRDAIWGGALQIWRDSPLFGAGPGRFALDYLRFNPGTPPGFWPVHAHSVFMQALAEFGLAGLVALLWLLAALARWLLSIYRRSPLDARPALVAVFAGLTALLVQLIFDEFSGWWAVMVPAIFLIAWAATQRRAVAEVRDTVYPRIPAVWLSMPLALLLIVAGFSLWAYQPLATAAASSVDPHTLAFAAVESARRDPSFHFYQAQAGLLYAWDWQASADPASLSTARTYLANAIAREPSTSWLTASLAVLDFAAGDTSLAFTRMRHAEELSSQVAVYPLALGRFSEIGGDADTARAAYTRALALDPALSIHPFWQHSALRRTVLSSAPPVASQPAAASELRPLPIPWIFDDTVDYTYSEFIAERAPLGYSAAPGLMP